MNTTSRELRSEKNVQWIDTWFFRWGFAVQLKIQALANLFLTRKIWQPKEECYLVSWNSYQSHRNRDFKVTAEIANLNREDFFSNTIFVTTWIFEGDQKTISRFPRHSHFEVHFSYLRKTFSTSKCELTKVSFSHNFLLHPI